MFKNPVLVYRRRPDEKVPAFLLQRIDPGFKSRRKLADMNAVDEAMIDFNGHAKHQPPVFLGIFAPAYARRRVFTVKIALIRQRCDIDPRQT